MLVSSFKPEAQIFKDLYSLRAILPSGELSLDNYHAVFEKSNIVRFFYNSIVHYRRQCAAGVIDQLYGGVCLGKAALEGAGVDFDGHHCFADCSFSKPS